VLGAPGVDHGHTGDAQDRARGHKPRRPRRGPGVAREGAREAARKGARGSHARARHKGARGPRAREPGGRAAREAAREGEGPGGRAREGRLGGRTRKGKGEGEGEREREREGAYLGIQNPAITVHRIT
jgi:hypothetical protein